MAVKKIYYSMGEVSEMFDVRPSLLRHWESQFACLKPHKNQKGNRMFTPSDVENLKLIYHLVKEKGMTLEGANKTMKGRGKSVQREISILERLQNIRAMLVEVRESLGDDSVVEYEAPMDAPIEAVTELISDVEKEAKASVVSSVTSAEAAEESVAEEPVAEAAPRRRGRPRRSVQSLRRRAYQLLLVVVAVPVRAMKTRSCSHSMSSRCSKV